MGMFTGKSSPQTSAAARTTNSRSQDASSGQMSFIGPNIVFEGTLSGKENVVIEGVVRGNIDLASDVRVGTNARLEATVHARNVSVEGSIIGDVSADNRVELLVTADVQGNIKAPKIVVSEGAKFRGSVDMGSSRPSLVPTDESAEERQQEKG